MSRKRTPSPIHVLALSLPCRSIRCNAPAGAKCNRNHKNFHHRVRYNDAHRILSDQLKLQDWNKRHGGKSEPLTIYHPGGAA